MASLYLILSSIIFPVLAICWLCCIACCIYRSLIKALAKQGRTTKVQVLVSDTQDALSTGDVSAGSAKSFRTSTTTSSANPSAPAPAASAPLSQSLGGSSGFSALRGQSVGGEGVLPVVDTELGGGPSYRQMIVPKRGTLARSNTVDNSPMN